MAPYTTEADILQDYLLNPAPLSQVLPYAQFQGLFPATSRSHAQVKPLYRDLQFLRSVDVDVVRENIDRECRAAERIRAEMLRAISGHRKPESRGEEQGRKRKRGEDVLEGGDGNVNAEVAIDDTFFGPTGMLPNRQRDRYHNSSSLLEEMEKACSFLENEAGHTKEAAGNLLVHMRETVGGLSDLRYGKFARSVGNGDSMENNLVEALYGLEQACDRHAGLDTKEQHR